MTPNPNPTPVNRLLEKLKDLAMPFAIFSLAIGVPLYKQISSRRSAPVSHQGQTTYGEQRLPDPWWANVPMSGEMRGTMAILNAGSLQEDAIFNPGQFTPEQHAEINRRFSGASAAVGAASADNARTQLNTQRTQMHWRQQQHANELNADAQRYMIQNGQRPMMFDPVSGTWRY